MVLRGLNSLRIFSIRNSIGNVFAQDVEDYNYAVRVEDEHQNLS